jgi:hypothetical protein
MTQALVPTEAVLFQTRGMLILGKLRVHPVRYELQSDRIVVWKQPRILLGLGLIGLLFAAKMRGKRHLDLELSQIRKYARGKYGLNKRVLDVTLADGAMHRLIIDKFDPFVDGLSQQLAARGNPLALAPS